jgi:hypothetical protein
MHIQRTQNFNGSGGKKITNITMESIPDASRQGSSTCLQQPIADDIRVPDLSGLHKPPSVLTSIPPPPLHPSISLHPLLHPPFHSILYSTFHFTPSSTPSLHLAPWITPPVVHRLISPMVPRVSTQVATAAAD